jgi:hypothetical protein
VTDRKEMEGSCSTCQNPQRAAVPGEEEEEYHHVLGGQRRLNFVECASELCSC